MTLFPTHPNCIHIFFIIISLFFLRYNEKLAALPPQKHYLSSFSIFVQSTIAVVHTSGLVCELSFQIDYFQLVNQIPVRRPLILLTNICANGIEIYLTTL